jgi:hypothetical protein
VSFVLLFQYSQLTIHAHSFMYPVGDRARPWSHSVLVPQPDLRHSLTLLIEELDRHMQQRVAIACLADRFAIKTRRLYDFINVLSALGCCQKSGLDHVIWLGRERIPTVIHDLLIARDIENHSLTLCEIFPVTGCIGIVNLTISFLLMFHALRTNHLDLRFIGHLFSRQTTRYKSTLCKLYQISYVLCAAGVLKRTMQVCDVVLLYPYLDFAVVPPEPKSIADPYLIQSLLNRPGPIEELRHIYRRRKELYDLFIGSVASKTVMLPDPDLFPVSPRGESA